MLLVSPLMTKPVSVTSIFFSEKSNKIYVQLLAIQYQIIIYNADGKLRMKWEIHACCNLLNKFGHQAKFCKTTEQFATTTLKRN